RREVKLGKKPGKKFVMRPDLYIPIAEKKVFAEAATHSGISSGVIKAAWDAAGEVIRTWATEGHSVPLPGLGTMRFGVRSKAVEKLEDVKANLITTRRIVFTPNVDVKDELKNTAIQITCLDEEGNVLKRVTSGDSGTIEDPEENENGESENSGSGSENSGSGSSTGSETESVTAPEISGQTPFTDSTQVTIQGPQGAEVRYTTDGSAPSAESTLYSEAITLNATTTIKAIAILDGESSAVASKTFTKSGESGGFDLGN
ncbi:MAG: chitobiase/beta-hexosaminidase C-terminal domain-containing protein, partial [Prevotella sp.]|nr:chitobiase/beta-hexosaminidase C-terminal domain-containing protein [Prevotella sp.]